MAQHASSDIVAYRGICEIFQFTALKKHAAEVFMCPSALNLGPPNGPLDRKSPMDISSNQFFFKCALHQANLLFYGQCNVERRGCSYTE